MKKLCLLVLAGFLFSCMSWPPPSPRNPYRPLRKAKNALVIDTIESEFLSYGIAGFRDDNARISGEAYNILLKLAKEKYGDGIDVVDVTWVETRWVAGVDNPSEFMANGKIIIFNNAGIESALARAGRNVVKNIPKNSVIAIVYIAADNQITENYLANELENILVNEGYNLSARGQMDIIRQEQNYQLSGEVADDTSVRIGKILGANIIITGKLEGSGNLRRLMLRALNTETGLIVGSASEQL
ncbi:MAG: penicillin-binding protein activator LpoB [Treponema sp.]|nr:penicillin-binding protein activator LpoB [Treponema sp.]